MSDIHPTIDGFTLVMNGPLPRYIQGGFGRVYRAEDGDGLLVAIKVPRPDRRQPELLRYWAEECSISQRLPPHENVLGVRQRTIAEWPDGGTTDALVMDWLDGARGLLEYADELTLDRTERLLLFDQCLAGAAWFHAHGVPHCDLKSRNMLVVDRDGQPWVRVADFGGSRRPRQLDPRAAPHTVARAAPEVVRGDPAAIRPSADVYSLCKECAELLGGPDAVEAPANDHTGWRPVPVREVLGLPDPALDAVIARGVESEPSKRYRNATELRKALAAYRAPAHQRSVRWLQRRLLPDMPTASPGHIRWRWAALGLFAVLAALMAVATCRQLVGSALGPYLQLRPIAVPGLDHVVIVRAKSPESVAELATRLGIAGVDSGRAVTARPVWGRVLVDCAKSSGSVIGVDIFFRHSESEDLNAAVLEAVGEAIHSGGGRRIVLATDDFSPLSPDSRLVDPMVHGLPGIGVGLGCYSLVRLAGIGYALVIPQERNGPPRQPLAVALVASFLDSNTAAQVVIDRADNVLRFLLPSNRGRAVQLFAIRRWSMETDGPDVPEEQQIRGLGPEDYLGFCPFGVPSDDIFAPVDLDLNDLYSANGVLNVDLIRDRIVLLAAFSEDDMHEVDDRIVPGVWLHAAAIESLLAQIPAPKVSWWILVPLSAVAGLAMLLSISLARRWCRIRGIPLPLRSGGWTRPVRRPRLDVESCKHYSLWLGLGTVGLPVIVVAVGTVTGLEVHYRSAVFVAAAASGGLLGLWIVLALAWMGCVRRAWCLDRFVEPRGGFCERSATTTTI